MYSKQLKRKQFRMEALCLVLRIANRKSTGTDRLHELVLNFLRIVSQKKLS